MFLSLLLLAVVAVPVSSAQEQDNLMADMQTRCEESVFRALSEERDVYRRVQHGAAAPEEAYADVSVLNVASARTSDLVPYLVLYYHALSCRLRMICDAADASQGYTGAKGSSPPEIPIGCSRLFAVRGRFWSPERRPLSRNTLTIPECRYTEALEQRAEHDIAQGGAPGFGVPPSFFTVTPQCHDWTEQILREERQMLRLLVAQDSAERGTRQVVGVFQAVLRNVRDNFLEPLRGLVDLFGAVIHPIPCLLTQCN